MLSLNQNTALILFTRKPQDELAHKKILINGKDQKQLFCLLVRHAQALGQQTGLPFFVVNSADQKGDTFGERLQNAFAAFFAQGFAKVIAIGNDCVQLKAKDIKQAAAQLQNHQAVFGPARDGGVYLLGLEQALFRHQPGFADINWQTATVLTELQTWCTGYQTLLLPRVYADLDTFAEVQTAFAAKQLPFACLALLADVFAHLCYCVNRFICRITPLYISSYSFRGPPVY